MQNAWKSNHHLKMIGDNFVKFFLLISTQLSFNKLLINYIVLTELLVMGFLNCVIDNTLCILMLYVTKSKQVLKLTTIHCVVETQK